MFFIGIFGTNEDKKEIRVFNNVICPACGVWTRYRLIMYYSYFHFFFIPLFRFNKRYMLLGDCGCPHYEADKEYFDELKDAYSLDFSRLRCSHDGRAPRCCPACGRAIDGEFSFCPYCGERL